MVAIQPVIVYGLLRVFADHARPSLSRAYLPYLVSGSRCSDTQAHGAVAQEMPRPLPVESRRHEVSRDPE
jgi:hypothetical protein